MKFREVRVLRSELSSHVEAVAPWEIPVLQTIFPVEAIVLLGEITDSERDVPDANDEMDRLIRHYGMDNESGVPYATQAYGMGQMGIRNLEKEIKAARTAVTKPAADPLSA